MGTVHFEFIPHGQQSTKLKCGNNETVTWICAQKKPELCPSDLILHHDYTPAHKTLFVKQFLAQKSITKLKQPPYSPDLAPCDFWFLPKIKSALKERIFQYTVDTQRNVMSLKNIPQDEFQNYFHQW
jgi:hypothetical protein